METNWISSLPNNIVKEVAVTPGDEKTMSLVRKVVKKTPHNGKKDIEETIGD